jgi:probable rRNA maturation factor
LSRIAVLNRQRGVKISGEAVSVFCARLLQSLQRTDDALSIVFVNAREIRSINRRYRGKDGATDVLSFSYGGVRMEEVPFLGEIIIAPEIAVKNARRYGIAPDKEIRKLLTHGTLHLLGYDHERDEGQMNRIQAKLLQRKFFSCSPCIIPRKAAR